MFSTLIVGGYSDIHFCALSLRAWNRLLTIGVQVRSGILDSSIIFRWQISGSISNFVPKRALIVETSYSDDNRLRGRNFWWYLSHFFQKNCRQARFFGQKWLSVSSVINASSFLSPVINTVPHMSSSVYIYGTWSGLLWCDSPAHVRECRHHGLSSGWTDKTQKEARVQMETSAQDPLDRWQCRAGGHIMKGKSVIS